MANVETIRGERQKQFEALVTDLDNFWKDFPCTEDNILTLDENVACLKRILFKEIKTASGNKINLIKAKYKEELSSGYEKEVKIILDLWSQSESLNSLMGNPFSFYNALKPVKVLNSKLSYSKMELERLENVPLSLIMKHLISEMTPEKLSYIDYITKGIVVCLKTLVKNISVTDTNDLKMQLKDSINEEVDSTNSISQNQSTVIKQRQDQLMELVSELRSILPYIGECATKLDENIGILKRILLKECERKSKNDAGAMKLLEKYSKDLPYSIDGKLKDIFDLLSKDKLSITLKTNPFVFHEFCGNYKLVEELWPIIKCSKEQLQKLSNIPVHRIMEYIIKNLEPADFKNIHYISLGVDVCYKALVENLILTHINDIQMPSNNLLKESGSNNSTSQQKSTSPLPTFEEKLKKFYHAGHMFYLDSSDMLDVERTLKANKDFNEDDDELLLNQIKRFSLKNLLIFLFPAWDELRKIYKRCSEDFTGLDLQEAMYLQSLSLNPHQQTIMLPPALRIHQYEDLNAPN